MEQGRQSLSLINNRGFYDLNSEWAGGLFAVGGGWQWEWRRGGGGELIHESIQHFSAVDLYLCNTGGSKRLVRRDAQMQRAETTASANASTDIS